MRKIQACAENKQILETWGFDPALDVGIRFSTSLNLISQTKKGYILTSTGSDFSKKIIADGNVLIRQITFLQENSLNITENMVEAASKRWEKNENK